MTDTNQRFYDNKGKAISTMEYKVQAERYCKLANKMLKRFPKVKLLGVKWQKQ